MCGKTSSQFSETSNLQRVMMSEYAIAGLAIPILAQEIVSCSAIHFIGKSEHAVLHYPARLLVNCVTESCFPENQQWYRDCHLIPKSYKVDAEFISVLQDIKEKVNPIQIKFFTPFVGIDKCASYVDAELIEDALKSIFVGIKCSQSSSLDDCYQIDK